MNIKKLYKLPYSFDNGKTIYCFTLIIGYMEKNIKKYIFLSFLMHTLMSIYSHNCFKNQNWEILLNN